MDDKDAYRKAARRVAAKMGFYIHFSIYVAVNILLFVVNRTTDPGGYHWFIWPLLGWGIGVFFHFLGVFVFSGGLKARMIQKELERQKRG